MHDHYYSRNDMLKAVADYLKKKRYKVSEYDPKFEPARVPVFAYKYSKKEKREEPEIVEEIFVDIITEININPDNYFNDRNIERILGNKAFTIENASSAQFFRHYFPSARIFWAIPDYSINESQYLIFEKKCKADDIGLFVVTKNEKGSKVEERLNSRSLLEERFVAADTTLGSEIDLTIKGSIKEKIEKWTQEDLSYHIYYPEPTFTATDVSSKDPINKISTELINKVSDLEKVSYRRYLSDFSNSYHSRSGQGDYKIAMEVIENLWKQNNIEYPKMHRDYEPVLKLDPKYRDHFLHSFQVFLYGVYILDKCYSDIPQDNFIDTDGSRIEDAWLIASTYHDYNYMVERFKKWTDQFFKDALHLKDSNNPASLHLSESYVKDGYMFNTKRLAKNLNVQVDKIFLDFLYDRILEKYNHGLLSGLSLLKYLENNKGCRLSDKVVDSACKAISIHDKKVWHYLSGLADNIVNDDIGNKLRRKKVIKNIIFDQDPIPFLLILSDTIQEQGRERDSEVKAELDSLHVTNSKVFTRISFDGNKSSESFKIKIDEFKKVTKFLKGNKRFQIQIFDKKTDESHEYTI